MQKLPLKMPRTHYLTLKGMHKLHNLLNILYVLPSKYEMDGICWELYRSPGFNTLTVSKSAFIKHTKISNVATCYTNVCLKLNACFFLNVLVI